VAFGTPWISYYTFKTITNLLRMGLLKSIFPPKPNEANKNIKLKKNLHKVRDIKTAKDERKLCYAMLHKFPSSLFCIPSWCTLSNINVRSQVPAHSCVPSAVYLPTGSLTIPPSRRGFTYKDVQNSELEAKWTKSMHNLPHKNNKAESNKSSNGRSGQHQVID